MVDLLTAEKFAFVSRGLATETFAVIDFKGTEGLSQCYEFIINLVSREEQVDLSVLLKNPAVFTIRREQGDIPFYGILASFEQHGAGHGYARYRAVLRPKLWWLSLTHHNQVFLDQTLPQIIETVLKDGGLLPGIDFELRLTREYDPREYVCQYGESHLNFVGRWMEREGIYYYFEQTDSGEKVILSDSKIAHIVMPEGKTLVYSPPSGLDQLHREEVIQNLVCRRQMMPQSVVVKDYNYHKPSLDLTGRAQVAPDTGRGEFYVYGDHFFTPEEGHRVAGLRAESLQCRETLFHGESAIPFLRPGYVFDLENHFRDDYNRSYLTTGLSHAGTQTFYLVAGLKETYSQREQKLYYQNSFTAIPAEVQFRARHKTQKSRFHGTISAKIDAAPGAGQYAFLDDQGRYKVRLPFDQSGRRDGKASAWIRMAQPYAGAGHGFHFPLHGGTEVLLSFIDGDPDRPIITGAVPNPETPSVVSSGNAARAGFKTKGGGHFYADDSKGHEHFAIKSGSGGTTLHIGAGSGDELSGASKGMFFTSATVANVMGMIGRHNLSMVSDVSITGSKWAILIKTLENYVTKVATDLTAESVSEKGREKGDELKKEAEDLDEEAEDLDKEAKESEEKADELDAEGEHQEAGEKREEAQEKRREAQEKRNEAEKKRNEAQEKTEEADEKREHVKETFEASVEIFTELLMFGIMHKMEHSLDHMLEHKFGKLVKNPNGAFVAASKGGSTYVINKGLGKDLILFTDNGRLIGNAEKGVLLNTDSDMIALRAKNGIIYGRAKTVQLKQMNNRKLLSSIELTDTEGNIKIEQAQDNAAGIITQTSQRRIDMTVGENFLTVGFGIGMKVASNAIGVDRNGISLEVGTPDRVLNFVQQDEQQVVNQPPPYSGISLINRENVINIAEQGIAIKATRFEIKQGNFGLKLEENNNKLNFNKLELDVNTNLNFNANRINFG